MEDLRSSVHKYTYMNDIRHRIFLLFKRLSTLGINRFIA